MTSFACAGTQLKLKLLLPFGFVVVAVFVRVLCAFNWQLLFTIYLSLCIFIYIYILVYIYMYVKFVWVCVCMYCIARQTTKLGCLCQSYCFVHQPITDRFLLFHSCKFIETLIYISMLYNYIYLLMQCVDEEINIHLKRMQICVTK